MADRLSSAVDALAPEIVAWRRELHQHPELGFEERRTAAFVAERLRRFGLEVHTEIAGTGVVGILRAGDAKAPAVLLRADMDALPIQEVPGREYGSRVDGKMHACGHDGHTAMLLGAAKILAERRDELPQSVVCCFQPAEEGQGGAQRMIDDGVLQIVEVGRVFGLHLWSLHPAGTFHLRSGPMMAAQDEFEARILGRGGHAAQPHATRDPIVAAASAVTALQSIVSRSVDPIEPAVVSVGSFRAGRAANVIPDVATLRGTLRSFDEEVRQTLRARVREVLEGSAAAAGCRVELDLQPGFPAVVNEPGAVEQVRAVAAQVVGADKVIEQPPMAASEDFSFFLRERPGAFVFLGAGNEERGIVAPHHSPAFDIDESALARGTELHARLALTPLGA